MKTKNLIARLSACLALGLLSHNLQAQPPIVYPATMPDLNAGRPTNPQNLNCDMIQFVLGSNQNTFSAIVWDNYPVSGTPSVSIKLDFRGYTGGGISSPVAIPLANAARPDVAIGITGSQIYLGVTYERNKLAMLNVYPVTFTTSPYNVSLGAPVVCTLSSTGTTATWPHIDAWINPPGVAPYSCYQIPDFVTTWQELSGGVYNLKAATRTFAAPLTPGTVNMIPTNATDIVNSDVSARVDYNTVTFSRITYMSVVYTKNNGSLKDLYASTGQPILTSTPTTLETAQKLEAPRIESRNYLPTGYSAATWMAVCPKLNGSSGLREIRQYDNNGGAQNVSATFGATDDYSNAAISGTSGEPFYGSSVWYHVHGIIANGVGNTRVKMTPITFTGGPGTLAPSYLEVNQTPMTAASPGTIVAASGSSSTGTHQLAAWYDPTMAIPSIMYKISYDSSSSPHFRATGVSNVTTAGLVTLYPNPTNGDIMLSGIEKADYIVMDAIGRQVSSGIALPGNPIQTAWLPAGNYFLKVSENGRQETLRFVKQ